MLAFVIRRIGLSIPVLLIASIIVFLGVSATSDPTARLRFSRDPGVIKAETKRLGLDKPVTVRYVKWLSSFAKGDWGQSFVDRQSVKTKIAKALWVTLQLIFFGVAISAVIAIAIGIYSATRQYSVGDVVFTGASFVGLSMPPFWFGLIAIDLVTFKLPRRLGWDSTPLYSLGLHSSGQSGFNVDYLRHLVLPVATLTVQIIASWSRYQRSSMLDVMGSDYIRTARAKGLPRRRVVLKHGLRNALIPLVTIMAVDIGVLFGGLVITEQIFSIPGMGRVFLRALENGDTNVMLPWLMVSAAFIVAFNLVADVLYGVLDPRIRLA
ncbi:MAG: ABC transporter permease [Acidimicrobiales bacterium]